jgi:hypothetical protein
MIPIPPGPAASGLTSVANPTRRRFLKDLLRQTFSLVREARGIPQLALEDLPQVPDHTLREMIPVWREEYHPEVRPDGLYESAAGGATVKVYSFTPNEAIVAAQFARGHNLQSIAEALVVRTGGDPVTCFQITRRLFLEFARRGWCHPAADHLDE